MKLLLEISATATAKNKLQQCIHSFMEQFTGSTLDESEANAFLDRLSAKIKEFNEAHKKCTPADVNTWCITDKLCFGVQAGDYYINISTVKIKGNAMDLI